MRLWLLMLTACGQPQFPSAEAYPLGTGSGVVQEQVFVGPLEDPAEEAFHEDAAAEESHHEDASETATEKAAEVRGSLDALRCYLLHKANLEGGLAPDGWAQLDMNEYEVSSDPCTLLPGFVDPKKAERDALLEQKEVEEDLFDLEGAAMRRR